MSRMFTRRRKPVESSSQSRRPSIIRRQDDESNDDDSDYEQQQQQHHQQVRRRGRGGGAAAASGRTERQQKLVASSSRSSKRKRRDDSDDDEAHVFDANNADDDDDDGDAEFTVATSTADGGSDPMAGLSSLEREGMVARMVRYALFSDVNKLPMKRDEINRVVLGVHSRRRNLFRHVLAAADLKLRTVFGFEIKEIVRSSGRSSTTMWVLRMCHTHSFTSDRARVSHSQEILGHSADETPQIGLLMVILALIFANDERIGEEALFDHLKTLGLYRGVDHRVLGKPEKLLDNFVRELYLERKRDELSNATMQARTAQAQVVGEAPKVEYFYSMGPRSKLEVQKLQIVEFLSSVTGMAISDSTKARLEKEQQMSQQFQEEQQEQPSQTQPDESVQPQLTRSLRR